MTGFVTREEYEALPPELQKEILINEDYWLIYEIIKEFGGEASIDRLLIEFYRRTNQIKKRSQMVAIAYKAVRKGVPITPDKRRKGIYCLVSEKDKK